MSSEESGKG